MTDIRTGKRCKIGKEFQVLNIEKVQNKKKRTVSFLNIVGGKDILMTDDANRQVSS